MLMLYHFPHVMRFHEAVFRVYAWTGPTLSFGRNQTTRGAYEPGLARDRGVDVVRRPTGGRARCCRLACITCPGWYGIVTGKYLEDLASRVFACSVRAIVREAV